MKFIGFFLAAATGILPLQAQAADPGRGELLYDTHCIACHSAQVHWRDQRLVEDWSTLTAQVRRWQSTVGLNWNDQDIAAVAEYLNKLYYRFPERESNRTLSYSRAE